MVANEINGSGSIHANSRGRVRLEAFEINLPNSITSIASTAPPIQITPIDAPTITITNVAGQTVPGDPTGQTQTPDVFFEESGAVTIALTTENIPEGTTITVQVNASGQIIEGQAVTDSAGDASVDLTVPAGVGAINAFAQF